MKLFSLGLIAIATLMFLVGCASESGGYTAHQLAAQHAGYDPTARMESSTRY